jgi:hypothetical protein
LSSLTNHFPLSLACLCTPTKILILQEWFVNYGMHASCSSTPNCTVLMEFVTGASSYYVSWCHGNVRREHAEWQWLCRRTCLVLQAIWKTSKQTRMHAQGRVHQWSNRVFSLLFLIGETLHLIASVSWAKRRKSLQRKQRHSDASYLLDAWPHWPLNQRCETSE